MGNWIEQAICHMAKLYISLFFLIKIFKKIYQAYVEKWDQIADFYDTDPQKEGSHD